MSDPVTGTAGTEPFLMAIPEDRGILWPLTMVQAITIIIIGDKSDIRPPLYNDIHM